MPQNTEVERPGRSGVVLSTARVLGHLVFGRAQCEGAGGKRVLDPERVSRQEQDGAPVSNDKKGVARRCLKLRANHRQQSAAVLFDVPFQHVGDTEQQA